MLSTRAAHTLLAAAHTPTGLRALAHALGFSAPAHPLGRHACRTIGLGDTTFRSAARITRDEHALLIIEGLDHTNWRDTVRRLASRLDRLADPRRWLLLLQCRHDGPIIIACWLASPRGPDLAVLTSTAPHIPDSDAQAVAALAATWLPDPTLTALRRHELLGRHTIGKRFFRALESHVQHLADAWPERVHDHDRRTLAIIHVARLIFLKFLEAKGWLHDDRSFLARHTTTILGNNGKLWPSLVAPLTFGTLNTPARHRAPTARAFGHIPFLNGGLFASTPIERRSRYPAIPNEPLADLLLDTLAKYRFTAREDATSWSEAAIDPDLLGRTFEALMDAGDRRGSGTFYTPGTLVTTIVDDALLHTIRAPRELVQAALRGEAQRRADCTRLRDAIGTLRILDPACGSGSLLVATLERLATLHQQLGDPRSTATLRRHVLTHSIFGVDIAPIAVWLCELRLWLSVVIDDDTTHPRDITPLPNLDHHIRTGDALGSDAFEDRREHTSRRLAAIRARYAQSAGAKKRTLARRIESLERDTARRNTQHSLETLRHERAELLRHARQRTLFGTRQGLDTSQRKRLSHVRAAITELRRTLRRLDNGSALTFDFQSHFSDAADDGGFDLVLGNPPWVRPHHLDAATRHTLKHRFAAVTRHHTAGTPFGVQSDIAIPFTHRGLALTKPGGTLAFILPAKLWRSVAAGALREHLLRNARPLQIRDYSGHAAGFNAAVYPSTVILRRHATPTPHLPAEMDNPIVDCHTADAAGYPHQFTIPAHQLSAGPAASGAPWRVIPSAVRAAAETLTAAGTRWNDSIIPPPSLGIKTGCNEAFLLSESSLTDPLRTWARPVLRGESLHAWSTVPHATHIVIPHDAQGRPLTRLPAPLSHHLTPFRRVLTARTDLRPRDPWWAVFRTELLDSTGWRVVWADIGRTLRATLLAPGTTHVPLNSCYGVRLHDPIDAHALTALLNAPTTTAWLSLIAEPARGGYHRFLGWTVMSLPLPHWPRARELLAPLTARARRGEPVSADALHASTLAAYDIPAHAVTPLIAWTSTELRTARTTTSRAS